MPDAHRTAPLDTVERPAVALAPPARRLETAAQPSAWSGDRSVVQVMPSPAAPPPEPPPLSDTPDRLPVHLAHQDHAAAAARRDADARTPDRLVAAQHTATPHARDRRGRLRQDDAPGGLRPPLRRAGAVVQAGSHGRGLDLVHELPDRRLSGAGPGVRPRDPGPARPAGNGGSVARPHHRRPPGGHRRLRSPGPVDPRRLPPRRSQRGCPGDRGRACCARLRQACRC